MAVRRWNNMYVRNQKCILRLSLRTLTTSRKRNWITVCAIALTTLLFTSLFTIMMSLNASYETYTFRQIGGYSHGTFKDITPAQEKAIRGHSLIKEAGSRQVIGAKSDGGFKKRSAEISYMDHNTAKWSYALPTTGRVPKSGQEIAMDTISLKLLGVTPKLGEKVTLPYVISDNTGQEISRTDTFTLTGYWTFDNVMPVHYINISRDYANKMISFGKKQRLSGFFTDLNVMFSSSFNIANKMQQVDKDLGYDWNTRGEKNSARIGVNWGYTTSKLAQNQDPITLVGITSILLLVVFTGFLIIYNIFQISVTSDIRYYGLLKTIGVTPPQLRLIILQQALFLCAPGIPIGLLLGYGLGALFTPLVLSTSSDPLTNTISTSPLIFLISALLALITVFLSCFRPGHMAAKVSPVEAVRYTEGSESRSRRFRIRRKKSPSLKTRRTHGAKVPQMAFANLGRNRKKTFLVVLSLSLSVALLNILVLFVNGFDLEKYVSQMICSDFIVSGNDYFRYNQQSDENISANTIKEIQQNTKSSLSGCGYAPEEGRQPVTWMTRSAYQQKNSSFYTKQEMEQNITYDSASRGKLISTEMQLEILDNALLSKIQVYQGDLSHLSDTSGHNIAIAVETDDYGHIVNKNHYPKIGETLSLSYIHEDYYIDKRTGKKCDDTTPQEDIRYHIEKSKDIDYTVCAYVIVPYSMSYRYSTLSGYEAILPLEQFQKDSGQKASRLFYLFDTPNHKAELEAERYLKQITSDETSELSFESKETQRISFRNFQKIFVIGGSVLCAVIALIGILNFINAIITGILTRRHEFAMLQAVGMTNRQLRHMLVCEGVFYAISASLSALLLSVLLILPAGRLFQNTFWFFTLRINLAPVLISIPVFLLAGSLIPGLIYRHSLKETVVERLRTTE